MTNLSVGKRFVIARLEWLIAEPTNSPSAGITAYREQIGTEDLFSVFVRFQQTTTSSEVWSEAKIFALVEEMESRLPTIGGRLVLTAGEMPVAIAEVILDSREVV